MSNLWGREPVLFLDAIKALLALAVGFGLDLSGEQVALLVTAASAVLGLIARSRVSPVAPPEDPPPDAT